jgi:hypothetical protein
MTVDEERRFVRRTRTAVAGRLQILRILQGFKFPLQAFFDEAEALAFLGISGDGVKQGDSRSIRRD